MSSFSISSELICSSVESDYWLNDSQLKASQLIREFCSEAIAWAPLCGMMLGKIAAPLVRFQSSKLLGAFGFGNTVSHGASWIFAMSTEGVAMSVTPSILMGQGVQPEAWRGISHGTVTMMVCQGIAQKLHLPGMLGGIGQDFGVMGVNWVFGEFGITEKAYGGLLAQWTEARVVSCRMMVSSTLVRATCVEATYFQAKYDVNYRSQAIQGQQSNRGGIWGFLSPQRRLAGNNGMILAEEAATGSLNSTQEIVSGPLAFFRKGDGRRGTRGRHLKGNHRHPTVGDRKREQKIIAGALSSMSEAIASLDQTPQAKVENGKKPLPIKDCWELLEHCSRKDPDLVKAVLAVAAAFEFPGMYDHRESLQAILRSPRLTSKEKYDAVVKRVDEIIIKDHELRKRWQDLQPKVSLIDKLLYSIPNLISLAGIGCGAYSMVLSAEGRFGEAVKYLVGAAIFDGLDGKIARLLRKSSEFGGTLDTGCDTVNYPVGGGFFAYEVLNYLGHPELGLVAGGLILFNGVLRLTIFEILRKFKILTPPQDIVGKKYVDGSAFWGTASTIEALVLPAAYVLFGNNPEAFYAIAAGSGTTMVMPVILSKIGGGTWRWIKKHPFPSAILGSAALSAVGTSVAREDPKYVAAATLLVWGSYIASGFIPQSKVPRPVLVQPSSPGDVTKSSEGIPSRRARRVRSKHRRGR